MPSQLDIKFISSFLPTWMNFIFCYGKGRWLQLSSKTNKNLSLTCCLGFVCLFFYFDVVFCWLVSLGWVRDFLLDWFVCLFVLFPNEPSQLTSLATTTHKQLAQVRALSSSGAEWASSARQLQARLLLWLAQRVNTGLYCTRYTFDLLSNTIHISIHRRLDFCTGELHLHDVLLLCGINT